MVSTKGAIQRLSGFIKQLSPTFNAPGIAIGITLRERILHAGFYGSANRETGEAVTPKTLFQIGSISKSFTSILLLQLQEEGLLDINEPVTKYLPWLEIPSEFAPITLRHLMSHTAGIVRGIDETVSPSSEAWNLRHTKATAPPGEMFFYSNTGYKTLGLVLQTLLKQDMATIHRERIFTPLGMDATLPDIRTSERAGLAVGYSPFYDERPLPPGGRLAPATWLECESADGSICSTAEDMCRYLRALLQRDNKLFRPESFEKLIEPIIDTDDGLHGEKYGLGLIIENIDGHHVIGHSGSTVGFTADMVADLDAGLGVIVLTNGPSRPMELSRYALKLFRAAQDGDTLPEFPDEGLENANDYVGNYRYGTKSFTLSAKQNRLYMNFDNATIPLHPRDPDNFIVPHPAFDLFALCMGRQDGKVTEAGWGGDQYVREGEQAVETSFTYPIEWEAYPGHYRSHNPWLSNFRVVKYKGSLLFIDPMSDEQVLHQLETSLFRIGDDPRSPEFIRFEMVTDGKAMQAVLSGGAYSRIFTP
jgi:D-alanyl-D-alanine carboxypeptidase